MIIKIAKEYTKTPGARYVWQGPFPGEEFRDKILYDKYIECLDKNEELIVDLDGGYGYGSSFLEESFGGLVRRLKKEKKDYKLPLDIIKIISNEETTWINKIEEYIKDAIKNPLKKEDSNNEVG